MADKWLSGQRKLGAPFRIVAAAFIFVFSGSCGKEEKAEHASHKDAGEHGTSSGWKFSFPKGDPTEGRKLFAEMECYKCHEVKGERFAAASESKKGVGPELSQMAGKHPIEFFVESIINPNAVIEPEDKELGYLGEDGRCKMPDYTDVLTVKQVADLTAYLASLKGDSHGKH